MMNARSDRERVSMVVALAGRLGVPVAELGEQDGAVRIAAGDARVTLRFCGELYSACFNNSDHCGTMGAGGSGAGTDNVSVSPSLSGMTVKTTTTTSNPMASAGTGGGTGGAAGGSLVHRSHELGTASEEQREDVVRVQMPGREKSKKAGKKGPGRGPGRDRPVSIQRKETGMVVGGDKNRTELEL